jgi:glyoxalase family protein
MQLEGIHHVTAITGDARQNVDFYTRVLGLRLVAKSVNQDEPTVYHLFYSDELGSPGADITFFEYPGARRGQAGPGMVHRVVWRVGSREALQFWAARAEAEDLAVWTEPGGSVRFADPEGLDHEIVIAAVPDEPLVADNDEIPAEMALQGFDGVRAYSPRPTESARMLQELLGATSLGEDTWEVRGPRRGGWIALDPPPMTHGVQGAGTVHHVAWFSTVEDHTGWLERVEGAGVRTSGIVDRHYFRSIYFREPSGVLYEIADEGPGFTRDLPLEELGTKVILPPWYEPRRAEIESLLTPLPPPLRPTRR